MSIRTRLTALILAFLMAADAVSSVFAGVERTRALEPTTVFSSEALAARSMTGSILGRMPQAWNWLVVVWRDCWGEIRIPADELPDEAYTGTPAQFIGTRMALFHFSQNFLANQTGISQGHIGRILREEQGMSKDIAGVLSGPLRFEANKFWKKVYLPYAVPRGWTTRENRHPGNRSKRLFSAAPDHDKGSLLANFMYRTRIDRGISQSDLAENLGIAQGPVSNWETGRAAPIWKSMVRWCLSLSVDPMQIKPRDLRWNNMDDAAFMALWNITAKAVRHSEDAGRRLSLLAADFSGGDDALAAAMEVTPKALRQVFDGKLFRTVGWYIDAASHLNTSMLVWMMPGVGPGIEKFEKLSKTELLRVFQFSLRAFEIRKGANLSRLLGMHKQSIEMWMRRLRGGLIPIEDFFELIFCVADSTEEFIGVFDEVLDASRAWRSRRPTTAERLLREALEAAQPSAEQLRLVEAMEDFKKLNSRKAEMLRLYLGVGRRGPGMERSELAARFRPGRKDLSRERISQILDTSIKRIYAEAGIMPPEDPPMPGGKSSLRRSRRRAWPLRGVEATA